MREKARVLKDKCWTTLRFSYFSAVLFGVQMHNQIFEDIYEFMFEI